MSVPDSKVTSLKEHPLLRHLIDMDTTDASATTDVTVYTLLQVSRQLLV